MGIEVLNNTLNILALSVGLNHASCFVESLNYKIGPLPQDLQIDRAMKAKSKAKSS